MKQYHQIIKRCAAVLVLIAIVCSMYVGVVRVRAEQNYKTVNISVNEADVRALANGNGMTLEEMLDVLRENGVSQILFKESTIASLETAGDLQIFKGADVKSTPFAEQLPEDLPINEGNYYLVVTSEKWRQQVLREVPAKIAGATAYDKGTLGVVAVPTSIEATSGSQAKALEAFSGVGVGFDQAYMEKVAAKDFEIIAQVCSWAKPTDNALKMLARDIKGIPNLAMLMFNDKTIPGYPKSIETLYQLLRAEDGSLIVPLGQIEFNPQKGFNALAELGEKDIVRLHTISNEEMSKFEGKDGIISEAGVVEAVDRFELAARERNMRSLLVRFFDINMPGSYLDTNLTYLNTLTETLEGHGFTVGGETPTMDTLKVPTIVRLLIGMGVCAGFLLLMMELGLPRLGVVGFVLSLLAWFGLYKLNHTLAVQLMALAGVIEFPILSCIHFLPPKKELSLGKAIGILLAMCAVSIIGAVLMVGLLSEKAFMLKLSSFVGIKLAHIIPILFVPIIIYLWRAEKPMAQCKKLLNKALDYKWAIIFGIVGIALMIYVARTGNDSGEISGSEAAMRQLLNDTMGVRPRSKEFLIGYPLTIVYLMYAYKHPSLWVLTIPLVIGQISLVNTYAHIHTPLLISLQRSFNGLVLGLVLSIALILLIKLGIKIFYWGADKIKAREA